MATFLLQPYFCVHESEKVTQFVNSVGVENKQNNKWNPIRAIDDQIKADCSLKTLTKWTGLMALQHLVWICCM